MFCWEYSGETRCKKCSFKFISCWKVFVRFKDYGFFVPKTGADGKSAIVNGYLSIDTLSVKQLKHYAEDAGKNEKEILKIKEPEITLSFMADGVIILDKTWFYKTFNILSIHLASFDNDQEMYKHIYTHQAHWL